jgi:4-hydroxy-tetrahydrodipicolinate synthase
VVLFDLAMAGRTAELRPLYEWFLPLLRLDVVVKFVQLITLVQEEVGMGSSRVRAPRLPLAGEELAAAKRVIAQAKRDWIPAYAGEAKAAKAAGKKKSAVAA